MINNDFDKPSPIVAVLCDRKYLAPHNFHCVGDKYLNALIKFTGALPWIVPAMGEAIDVNALLDHVDGLFLPGSYANIEPSHYGQTQQTPENPIDPNRDNTAFQLIDEAIKRKIPLFGVCRGFQEINVHLGGTLHQRVQDVAEKMDHREDSNAPVESQYADIHNITLSDGGALAAITGKKTAKVNSIHQQGIDSLAKGLQVEACADDGLVEAFSGTDKEHFLLGVQWHPEWQTAKHPFNASLFTAFRDACLAYKNR